MCEEAPNFTAAMAGNIPGGRRVENSYRVERSTARDFDASLISPLSGSKDQQSMVLTSKGPRDQRMELSVRTAIKFYFVQDMLGFDQPSQAVEWLIEKSEAAIRELPQPSSAISTSQISQYVVANRAAVSSSRVETGEQNSCSQDEYTFTDKDNRHRNLNEQILAARSCRGQRSCTAKTTKIKNNDSIGQGEKKEQRSMASKCRTRETANVVSPKEFRAKARERCRQRTKPKDKIHSQQSGISTGISQKSSMRPHYPTFCLQENTTPPSSMTNETTDANSSSNACLHGSMQLPQDSPPCIQKTPPAEMECSSHCSAPQQEGSSTQSTGMSFL